MGLGLGLWGLSLRLWGSGCKALGSESQSLAPIRRTRSKRQHSRYKDAGARNLDRMPALGPKKSSSTCRGRVVASYAPRSLAYTYTIPTQTVRSTLRYLEPEVDTSTFTRLGVSVFRVRLSGLGCWALGVSGLGCPISNSQRIRCGFRVHLVVLDPVSLQPNQLL